MNGSPTGFWGKLEKATDGTVGAWHPLIDHCADVAACAEAILQRTLIRKRLARLGGLTDLTEVQVSRLCVLTALHDLGKFNLGFQNKALASAPFQYGHVQEILTLFGGQYAATKRAPPRLWG